MANPGNVTIGAGTVFVAPIGTTAPTDATTSLAAGWRDVGYTDEGSTVTTTQTLEKIRVEEEKAPVLTIVSEQNVTIALALAEATRQNLALAWNAGANAATSGLLTLPAAGTELRVMLCLNNTNGSRWLLPQVFNGGDVETARRRVASKATIPLSFEAEVPTTAGLLIVMVWPSPTGLI